MSMVCMLQGLTLAQIELLADTSSLLPDLVRVAANDEGEARLKEALRSLPPDRRREIQAKAEESSEQGEAAEWKRRQAAEIAQARQRLAIFGPLEPPLGLGKMWHLLHYALAGDAGPTGEAGDILFGGQAVGENLGYGPARLYDPAEAADVSRHLQGLDSLALQDELDFHAMQQEGVYPLLRGPRDAQYDAALRRDAGRAFLRLQFYLSKMSDKGNGFLIWVS